MFISNHLSNYNRKQRSSNMKWETPTYQDYRFGFEVTMYIMNR